MIARGAEGGNILSVLNLNHLSTSSDSASIVHLTCPVSCFTSILQHPNGLTFFPLLTGGCSEGLDAFRLFFKRLYHIRFGSKPFLIDREFVVSSVLSTNTLRSSTLLEFRVSEGVSSEANRILSELETCSRGTI